MSEKVLVDREAVERVMREDGLPLGVALIFCASPVPEEITNLRQQLEQAEARVAELVTAIEDIRYCHPHDEARYIDAASALVDENHKPTKAWLLRKQAEAATGAYCFAINEDPELCQSVMARAALNHVDRYAQRLRQQAKELVKGGSNG